MHACSSEGSALLCIHYFSALGYSSLFQKSFLIVSSTSKVDVKPEVREVVKEVKFYIEPETNNLRN